MDEAPDYVEPAQGWRVWSVVDEGGAPVLRSLFHDLVWEPGVAVRAECRHRPALRLPRRSARRRHGAPDERCRCGIHAAFAPARVLPYFEVHGPGEHCRAIGVVSLWGDVVECESGYRAERAYPVRLYLPAERRRRWLRRDAPIDSLAAALERYDVPVEILPLTSELRILPVPPLI